MIAEGQDFPVKLTSIHIDGATRTRPGFLQSATSNLLDSGNPNTQTFKGLLGEIHRTVNKLQAFDIFRPEIDLDVTATDAISRKIDGPVSLAAKIGVKERSRVTFTTGTEIGNLEGSGHIHGTFRNVLGGAETASFTASTGTRTKASYNALFTTPILASPNRLGFVEAFSRSRSNQHYASHDQQEQGVRAGLRFNFPDFRTTNELSYTLKNRSITSLASDASATVRAEASDSVLSALEYIYTVDTRDYPMLPSSGNLLRTTAQIAGWFTGVCHTKFEVDSQFSHTIRPHPQFPVTFTASARGGFLCPFPSHGITEPSHLADRFILGGPTNVRGFRDGGLGPRDGKDAIGGDFYTTLGASILFPIRKNDQGFPLRAMLWGNAGRLCAIDNGGWKAAAKELQNGLPSIAAGVGLVYGHPSARFELTFGVPVVARAGERLRKGFNLGVGIEFL
ncbi:hypothetical protein BJ508DRAFT_88185 [Ascobolus immersus RN42]|uniref:Bacterial surface antigen (D15) domain-containing protein n=1 Tax=Ascobolus immersus RN42 TaxID=1160509 RepID=A0A3N4HAY1_ASCIM|nr:hypothetical protein BJ508DRAFT_88185 [Ascobolus immersus RN42]